MKKLLLLFPFLFLFTHSAHASGGDCEVSPPVTVGAGVTCVKAASVFGNAEGTSSVLFSPTAGDQLIFFGYMCEFYGHVTECNQGNDWAASTAYSTANTCVSKGSNSSGSGSGSAPSSCIQPVLNNPCNYAFAAQNSGTSGSTEPNPWSTKPCQSSPATVSDGGITWKAITLSIQDQNGTVISCFTWSPNSPVELQVPPAVTNSYLNWAAYCPSAPAGITSIQLVPTVATAAQASIMVQAYTGLCSTGACIDKDGYGSSATSTVNTVTASLSGPTSYNNELLVALNGTGNDEPLSPISPCFNIDPGSTEHAVDSNSVTGQIVASAGTTPSCGVTWTGAADEGGILMMAVKMAGVSSQIPDPPTDLTASVTAP